MCFCTYDLKLHSLPVELDCPDLEVHANRRDVALSVGVIGEPQQQARLSYTRVSDQEQLEEVIVSIRRLEVSTGKVEVAFWG